MIDNTEASNEIGSDLDATARAVASSASNSGASKAADAAVGTDNNAAAGSGTKSNASSGSNTSGTTSSSNENESTTKANPSVETNVASDVASNHTSSTQTEIVYKNCTDVRAAGAAPLHKGDPGYSKKLDRDGDGVACE
ncbi:excalibur calcium-binding domain-containing protein [Paenibacillus cellulosilyticus]|uniref:excalibur calcium-binding domain-containing protein n=1 Tax=Paenibacillus cellulosilyticus TaxID=375489 RepID=UPI001FEF2FF6|nr:excalibur calcium-binding domain-containing protein [Paenibacillus cellulosilyticus]